MVSVTNILFMLVFSPTLASPGSFFPVSSGGRDSHSALRGVPVELRDKILAFHRQLETPDNFTIVKTTPRPNSRVAGLAEWTAEDEKVRKRDEKEVRGELQTDLFRFSSKVALPPHATHLGLKPTKYPSKENFVHFLKRQARLRERIRKEWKRFSMSEINFNTSSNVRLPIG